MLQCSAALRQNGRCRVESRVRGRRVFICSLHCPVVRVSGSWRAQTHAQTRVCVMRLQRVVAQTRAPATCTRLSKWALAYSRAYPAAPPARHCCRHHPPAIHQRHTCRASSADRCPTARHAARRWLRESDRVRGARLPRRRSVANHLLASRLLWQLPVEAAPAVHVLACRAHACGLDTARVGTLVVHLPTTHAPNGKRSGHGSGRPSA